MIFLSPKKKVAIKCQRMKRKYRKTGEALRKTFLLSISFFSQPHGTYLFNMNELGKNVFLLAVRNKDLGYIVLTSNLRYDDLLPIFLDCLVNLQGL